MRIQDILVDGFGVWHELAIEQLSENMTVFFGRNEAGKTTLMQFLRSVLYGFSPERRTRYLPPVHGGMPGGALRVVSPGGVFDVRRTGKPTDDLGNLGQVSVLGQTGQRHGAQVLHTLLSGVDESIFNNVFAFGLREVQELGTLDDTDAAEQLYNLTSGLDRVSLVDVMRQLEAARAELLPSDDAPGLLPDLLTRRERLQRELQQLARQNERFIQVAGERTRLQKEVGELETRVGRLGREAKAVELALRISDTWERRRELDEQLGRIGAAIDLPENAIETLDELNEGISRIRQQVEQIKQKRFQLRQEAAIQPINRKLWSHAARIEALGEQAAWMTSLETQIRQLEGDATRLEAELGGQRETGYGEPETRTEPQREVSRSALTALRGPAKALRDQTRQLKQAKGEREAKRLEATEIQKQLEATLAAFHTDDLQQAMQEAGEQVARFRRRIQLEERIDKMTLHRKELDEENGELMEEQILPVNVLAWLGVPFVLGVALILGGLFWSVSAALGWPIAILGLGGWAVAVIMKVTLERSATRELEECQQQLEQVDEQLRQARQQRDELDRQLPPGGGALDHRLHEAEGRMTALEELLPLDAKRQAAEARSQAAQQRAVQLAEALKETRHRWQNSLRDVGLPDNLSPQDIRELAEGSEQAAQTRRQLQVRREELASRHRELNSLTERIAQLMREVDMQPEGDDPQTHLRQMTAALAHQQQLFQRRKVLKQQDRELRKETSQSVRELRRLRDQRERMLSRAGAEDDRQFKQLATRELRRRKLTTERDEANRRIRAALDGRDDQEQVARELDTHRDGTLRPRWEKLTTQLQDAERRLAQLHQRRGECIAEMRALAEDKRAAEAQFELARVEQQLEQAANRWRVLAAAGLLLETIRKTYETERQPETLGEASRYLEQLTEGQYTRIWTPLTKNILKVDDAHGNALPVEVLSRGTREAVFVSLRLALVAAYARRGAVLPLVLDDVMVNFDAQRLQAAARVLRDFALEGHQLLMFTCHEHVVRVFQQVQVEVRLVTRKGAAGEVEQLALEPPAAESQTDTHDAAGSPVDDDETDESCEADDELEADAGEEEELDAAEAAADEEDVYEEEDEEEFEDEDEEEYEEEWEDEGQYEDEPIAEADDEAEEELSDEASWVEDEIEEDAQDAYELAPEEEDELAAVSDPEAEADGQPYDELEEEPAAPRRPREFVDVDLSEELPPEYRLEGQLREDDPYRLRVEEDLLEPSEVSADFHAMLDELKASELALSRGEGPETWHSPKRWWEEHDDPDAA